MVKVLFESLTEPQKKEICFPWDHVDPKRGLLRTRVENNWRSAPPSHPDASPRSDRFRCGGRESNFLAAMSVQSGLTTAFTCAAGFAAASGATLCSAAWLLLTRLPPELRVCPLQQGHNLHE